MLELKDLLLRDMGTDPHLGLKLQVLVLVVLLPLPNGVSWFFDWRNWHGKSTSPEPRRGAATTE